MNRELRRSSSDPLLTALIKSSDAPRPFRMKDLSPTIKNGRTLFLVVFFILVFVITNILTVYTYKTMPTKKSLPDIISDNWLSFAQIRSVSPISVVAITNLITICLLITGLYYTFQKFNVANCRKAVFLFTIANIIRCLFFLSTQLSPPCVGYSDCNCANEKYENVVNNTGYFKMVLTYVFTFGQGTDKIPNCGDLMMSGSITLQWTLGLYILETFLCGSGIENRFLHYLINRVILVIIALFQILARVHYTIGAALSITFVELSWLIYGSFQSLNNKGYSPFLTSTFGQFFSWIEDDSMFADEKDSPLLNDE